MSNYREEREKRLDEELEKSLARLGEKVKECQQFRLEWQAWSKDKPRTHECPLHRVTTEVDEEASVRKSWETGVWAMEYNLCFKCAKDRGIALKSAWLSQAGVPENLLHSSFDTFEADNEEDREHLAVAKEFAVRGRGFFVMLGDRGRGKSMLGVALLRVAGSGRFITQAMLLEKLRDTYRDNFAEKITQACRKAKLLVLDELGFSPGGRDELPLIHSILDYRHGEKMPTVLTGNIDMKEFKEVLGERMVDRLKESRFKIRIFTGESRRASRNKDY